MRVFIREYRHSFSAGNSYSTLRGEQTMDHIPVMTAEVIRYLLHDDSKVIVDGTVGAGGHAEAILANNPKVQLIGIDRDPTAIEIATRRLAAFEERVRLVHGLFPNLGAALGGAEPVDGVLLDLGISSMQLGDPRRGFSYSADGPLDMRMAGEGVTASEWIKNRGVDELTSALRRYGEVRRARTIARGIKEAADAGAMTSTRDLRTAVERAVGAAAAPAALSRVFQAIRIPLNDELNMLQSFLRVVLDVVKSRGRIVFISYHSLEDRAVKSFFKRESVGCICPPSTPVCACGHSPRLRLLTRRVVKPSAAEVAKNPRCRSARLRAAAVL